MRKLLHRRAALAGMVFGGALLTSRARASDTTQYFYDMYGRLVRVQFQDGSTVVYAYDAAGNRTQVARTSSPPTTAWTQTIAVTGTGPVNLYSLATAAGYNGAQDANVTFTLASTVTISGNGGSGDEAGGIGIDVGAWPITSVYVQLALQISGKVYGGGGGGGAGNFGSGARGGDAIYCRAPITITVNSGGQVKAGGGGGGGGNISPPPLERYGGGGGGGGAPNGGGGAGGEGNSVNGHPGGSGTTGGGGAGGLKGGFGAGNGASGGNFATGGNNGGGGYGGSPGFAISKNGFTVPVTNNGTISGTVG